MEAVEVEEVGDAQGVGDCEPASVKTKSAEASTIMSAAKVAWGNRGTLVRFSKLKCMCIMF